MMMNSNELMNRAWQYDIFGMLCFVLANTSNNDFGRILFTIIGTGVIIGSLFAMLYAFKRSVKEQQARERMVKEIAELLLNDAPKDAKKRQKRVRSVKNTKRQTNTSSKPDKA